MLALQLLLLSKLLFDTDGELGVNCRDPVETANGNGDGNHDPCSAFE